VSRPPDLHALLGDDVETRELERLRRVHELLLAAGPPPELPPALREAPTVGGRRELRFSWFHQPRLAAGLALAAALAAVTFGIGYLVGHVGSGFDARKTVLMFGTGPAPNARASIEVGASDPDGNTPMVVHVRGLPKLPGHGYYELYLTKHRKPVVTCGTFRVGGTSNVSFRVSVPYALGRYDGWIVTTEQPKARRPGAVVLTTFV
jgi:hypothetical protein